MFDLGTRIEAAVLWILEAELGGDFRRATRDDRVRLEPIGNVCADGFVRVDGKWRPVDVKSAAPMGFERAEVGELDAVYLAQGECYCRAYNSDVCSFLFYSKSDSQLAEIEVERDDERWQRVLNSVATARGPNLPEATLRARGAVLGLRRHRQDAQARPGAQGVRWHGAARGRAVHPHVPMRFLSVQG